MIAFRRLMYLLLNLQKSPSLLIHNWAFLSFCVFIFLSGTASSGTKIEHDPQGFFGIPWGNSLADRKDLKEIDASHSLHIYTLKQGDPHIEGIPMESVKLYVLENKYARALFRYQGASTHTALLQYLETRFGKTDRSYGGMMRGLNQQYTWRGPETEISIIYHGFRERGFLTAESRVLAPLLLDSYEELSY